MGPTMTSHMTIIPVYNTQQKGCFGGLPHEDRHRDRKGNTAPRFHTQLIEHEPDLNILGWAHCGIGLYLSLHIQQHVLLE